MIADSVGLGKTWIGKKLLEDFAYHRRQKAVVVCPASLREMWRKELASATIAAQVVGMEELGREEFDTASIGDADCILVDESHNFRNGKSNRYLALDEAIQRSGGRGRDGGRKKIILLSATPINNDLYDLANQIHLFSQSQADYFRDAGIGDLNVYFRRTRRLAKQGDTPPGVLLFNLLEEVMVRNTRPFIRAAYPNATINGKPVVFPDRRLHTVEYDLGATWGGLYAETVAEIERLSLAPYQLESYRKQSAIRDEQQHQMETGREAGLVGIFKTRFLKRLESSIFAFRESLRRALVFEETYLDYLLDGTVVTSPDFQKLTRFLARDEEDEPAAASLAEDLDAVEEARAYLDSLPRVDLNQYDLRRLRHDVERDIELLRTLFDRTEPLVRSDGKLERLKELLAGETQGPEGVDLQYVQGHFAVCTSAVDRRRERRVASIGRQSEIRRIDSGNHPDERGAILAQFAPCQRQEHAARRADRRAHQYRCPVGRPKPSGLRRNDQLRSDLEPDPFGAAQRPHRPHRQPARRNRHWHLQLLPRERTGRVAALGRAVDEPDLGDRRSWIARCQRAGGGGSPEDVQYPTANPGRGRRGAGRRRSPAELAGPEMLLRNLKALLNRQGAESIADLPKGIHSGLRRNNCHGMFFYFQAPRTTGEGRRHFWRYIDARSHEITENRYEVAQRIACQPDEPRYIGDQDVFVLQEKVIQQILASEREVEARAAAPIAVDPVQQTVAEELKDALRRQAVDRELAKRCVRFLGQPMGRSLLVKLRKAYQSWSEGRDDQALLAAVGLLAEEFGKGQPPVEGGESIRREDLELICYEYVTE